MGSGNSGSQWTPRWREMDSNPRSPRRTTLSRLPQRRRPGSLLTAATRATRRRASLMLKASYRPHRPAWLPDRLNDQCPVEAIEETPAFRAALRRFLLRRGWFLRKAAFQGGH
jgi:hypothetical protein